MRLAQEFSFLLDLLAFRCIRCGTLALVLYGFGLTSGKYGTGFGSSQP